MQDASSGGFGAQAGAQAGAGTAWPCHNSKIRWLAAQQPSEHVIRADRSTLVLWTCTAVAVTGVQHETLLQYVLWGRDEHSLAFGTLPRETLTVHAQVVSRRIHGLPGSINTCSAVACASTLCIVGQENSAR